LGVYHFDIIANTGSESVTSHLQLSFGERDILLSCPHLLG
jgi:hypothetical protein